MALTFPANAHSPDTHTGCGCGPPSSSTSPSHPRTYVLHGVAAITSRARRRPCFAAWRSFHSHRHPAHARGDSTAEACFTVVDSWHCYKRGRNAAAAAAPWGRADDTRISRRRVCGSSDEVTAAVATACAERIAVWHKQRASACQGAGTCRRSPVARARQWDSWRGGCDPHTPPGALLVHRRTTTRAINNVPAAPKWGHIVCRHRRVSFILGQPHGRCVPTGWRRCPPCIPSTIG